MKVCIIGSYAKALVMTADRIPLAGETLVGYDYRETYGGKGSDMAVQAARLGAEVSYIGVVGDDNFGQEFLSLMKEEGIKTKGIRVTKERPTGVGFIVKDKKARNVIVVDKGANELFSREDIDSNMDLIAASDVILAQLEIPLDTALYAMKKGRELGKTTILNPAPAVDLTAYRLADVDIITPNETEARVVVGKTPDVDYTNEQIAEVLFGTGCPCVVMTLGKDGVGIFKDGSSRYIEPFDVEVVDSNGAGDCFNASLACGLADGKSLEDAAQYANVVAGLCCTKWETVPSYHTAKQVAEVLKSRA